MIDRPARRHLGTVLRRFAVGRITNDQFEDQLGREVWSSPDPGVQAIRWAAWTLYDDLREHRLDGADALDRAGRRHIARWLLFLRSDLEYEWPEMPGWLGLFLIVPNLVTFNLLGWAFKRWRDGRGDAEVWPFLRRSDLARLAAQGRGLSLRRNTGTLAS